jgi:hypothetical protein
MPNMFPSKESAVHCNRRIAASVALCLLSSVAIAQDKPVQYRWTTGKTQKMALTAKLNGSLPLMPNTEPVDLEATLRVIYNVAVKSVEPDGRAVIQFTVDSADADVVGIPVSIPMEDAHKVLDRVATFAPTGAVLATEPAPPLPFTLSIPGVDPQRLYALMFPVVFPETPLKVGDAWEYSSELLGSEGSPAVFRAKVLQMPTGTKGKARELRLAEELNMDVDQNLNAQKKPVQNGEPVAMTRKGNIKGAGIMVFDPEAGTLLRGHLTLQAAITEKALEETTSGQVSETTSKVKAVLQIQPATAEGSKKPATAPRKTSGTAPAGRKSK